MRLDASNLSNERTKTMNPITERNYNRERNEDDFALQQFESGWQAGSSNAECIPPMYNQRDRRAYLQGYEEGESSRI